jgi:hypothetical protein
VIAGEPITVNSSKSDVAFIALNYNGTILATASDQVSTIILVKLFLGDPH